MVAPAGVGRNIFFRKDGLGPAFRQQLPQFRLRVTPTQGQAAASSLQLCLKLAQSTPQKGQSFGTGVGRREQGRVGNENRDDFGGTVKGGRQGLVVGET